jgi:hypothetical protein
MSTMKVKILAKSLKKMINEIKSDRNAHQNTGAYLIANSRSTTLVRL